MKKILFLILVITVSCKNNKTESETKSDTSSGYSMKDKFELHLNFNNDRIRFDSISKAEYDKYNKTDNKNPLDTTHKIPVLNGILKLPLDNGKYIYFKDTLANTESSDIRVNESIGELNGMDFYVIMVSYYESAEFILVHKKTGKKYRLISEPNVSPGKRFIAASSTALETDILSNEFQIWETSPEGLSRLFDVRDQSWYIVDMKWISDNKLALKFESGAGAISEKYGILTIN